MNLPQNPIFIVGYPRSGTTLLQRLLTTQPGIVSFPETHYFCVIEKQLRYDQQGHILPECLDKVWQKIEAKMAIHLSLAEKENLFRLAENGYLFSKDLFEYLVNRSLRDLHPNIVQLGDFRWIEKTPNHAHFLERMIAFYPQAQILHILRHPVPAIFSRKLKFPFNAETPLAELTRRWQRLLRDVETFAARHPAQILTLRYEDLIADMERELRAISAFLRRPIDLTLTAAITRPQQQPAETFILPTELWKSEDRQHTFVNTNLMYRALMSKDDAALIESYVIDELHRYGYTSYF